VHDLTTRGPLQLSLFLVHLFILIISKALSADCGSLLGPTAKLDTGLDAVDITVFEA
jgi:hypothetical protein